MGRSTLLLQLKLIRSQSFKKRGNEKQFKINDQVLDCLHAGQSELEKNQYAAAKAYLEKGIQLINDRQKMILLADSEKCGWRTVEEYATNELTDNEEDEKRIFKASLQAERKLKEEKSMKKKRTPYSLPVSAVPAPLISAPFIQPSSSASSLWGVHLTGVLLETGVKIPVSFVGRWGIGEVIALSCIHRHMGPQLDRLSVTAR